jgi:S-DNA-T family DNA segregation ATPase FtsK/SpoIIIE
MFVLCLDEDPQSLPEECRAVVSCTDDAVSLRQSGAEDVDGVLLDLVEPAWTDRVGHALAALRDTTPSAEDSGLPRSARLLDCLGMPDPTAAGVVRRWTDRGSTDVVLGAGFDGDFRLDLRRDGPHALIAGTTGSGKSELLQTLVASLAVANRPDQLTFVLVDYKGGSAFKDCNKLPHTVGMVTDLDTHLVERALTSLGAELRRREHLLEGPGAKDLEDYWALRRTDPTMPAIPRLVLVIDEFASLKAELPDFVTGLVTLAQRGRSLGIHLVLATQRPSGVVSADIRANTNLRIALGYARLGPSGVVPFQAGRVGGRRPDAGVDETTLDAPLAWDVPWTQVGHLAPSRPRPDGYDTDEGATDLSVLVEAVADANELAGIPEQFTPWLPALPAQVTVDDLVTRLADGPKLDEHTVAWALQDRPDQQAQVPATFSLGRSGHLYVVGGPRSGRSTTLRTLAGLLAEKVPARDLHLYGLDCGNGALLPLTALPHTGAVVQRTEVERASRLLTRLTEEVRRRQDVLAQHGHADIDEQRAAAKEPEHRLPYILLLLDRWEGFQSDLAEVDLGRLLDAMVSLLREGASVGVQVLVSGDRTLLGSRTVSLVENKFVLRLPDRSDYGLAGLKPRDLPQFFPDGRGVWGDSGVEAQVALLGKDPSGAAQSGEIRRIAAEVEGRDHDLPPSLRPMRMGALSTAISLRDVEDDFGVDQRPPGWVPLGVGGDAVELLGLDLGSSPVALVAGASRTGRTTLLRFVAAYLSRSQRPLLVLSPRESALTEQVGAQACVLGTDAEPPEVVERLRGMPEGSVVLIDDAESYRDGPLAPVLLALVRQAADKKMGLVAAGVTEAMASGFSGWLYEARRGRQGVVLSPSEPLAGEVFSARVSRAALSARPTAGRGVFFDGSGDQVVVQVPHVD